MEPPTSNPVWPATRSSPRPADLVPTWRMIGAVAGESEPGDIAMPGDVLVHQSMLSCSGWPAGGTQGAPTSLPTWCSHHRRARPKVRLRTAWRQRCASGRSRSASAAPTRRPPLLWRRPDRWASRPARAAARSAPTARHRQHRDPPRRKRAPAPAISASSSLPCDRIYLAAGAEADERFGDERVVRASPVGVEADDRFDQLDAVARHVAGPRLAAGYGHPVTEDP
jgi:hypothetical protein